jgi:hypothetical protein
LQRVTVDVIRRLGTECLALEVGRGMTAAAVCTVLARVVRERGAGLLPKKWSRCYESL